MCDQCVGWAFELSNCVEHTHYQLFDILPLDALGTDCIVYSEDRHVNVNNRGFTLLAYTVARMEDKNMVADTVKPNIFGLSTEFV